jgi:PHD/YefM family antitoxin component YafN of YafNO toxin-antitoxin module
MYYEISESERKGNYMRILSDAIVSNTDMIKNYKNCREKAESFGSIFVLKNNQPDAVLFSISKYERLADLIEYVESNKPEDRAHVLNALMKAEANRIQKLKPVINL